MIPLTGYAKVKKYVESHAELTDREILEIKKRFPGPCLTISRQSGIETNLLCENIIDKLSVYYSNDWAYFDKDLIRKVISNHHLPPRIQKFLNEERHSTMSQMLNELLGIHPPMLELIHKMTNTILNLAEIGNLIIIGRGSQVITSHLKNSYRIRLVAPLDERINIVQKNKEISRDWAKRVLLKEEKNRKEFLQKTFRKNIDDPTLYHTLINVSQFTSDEMVRSIVEAVKIKYPNKKNKIGAKIKASKEYNIYA